MSYSIKNFLDETGLTTYDGLIKDYIELNIESLSASTLSYDPSSSGLSRDTIQEAIDELATENSGHEILNDAGTAVAQEESLQFKGTYVHDDSANGKTVVETVREMTSTQYGQLTEAERKGIIVTDVNNNSPLNLVAQMSGYDNTTSGLSATNVQTAIDELAQGGGGAGGHIIENDTGTSMTARSNLQFKGVYVEDDSTNNTTIVNIVKEYNNDAEVQALTGEAAKGLQHTPDTVYRGRTAADIGFDPTDTLLTETRVQEALEELDAAHLPYSNTQSTKQKIDELSSRFEVVEVNINASGDTNIPYPSGYNKTNTYIVSAKCFTKYNSWVDKDYDGFSYYGDVVLGTNNMVFTPKVEGNTTKIKFIITKD